MSDNIQNQQSHPSETDGFIAECRSGTLKYDLLKERYLEYITGDIIRGATILKRLHVHDFLENNGVTCGRGSREAIQGRLIQLLTPRFGINEQLFTSRPESGSGLERDSRSESHA